MNKLKETKKEDKQDFSRIRVLEEEIKALKIKVSFLNTFCNEMYEKLEILGEKR